MATDAKHTLTALLIGAFYGLLALLLVSVRMLRPMPTGHGHAFLYLGAFFGAIASCHFLWPEHIGAEYWRWPRCLQRARKA